MMKKLRPNSQRVHSGLLMTISCLIVISFGGHLMAQSLSSLMMAQGKAYRLPIAQKADIQLALDAHQIVVLDNGDYTVPNSTVILRSGYQLYGDPVGTSIPPVIVAPGTTGAVLSTVRVNKPGAVTFSASSQITSGNVIERLIGDITVAGGTLQDNLFLHIDGQINIDNSIGGFMRNNRFIRTKTQSLSDQLVMQGDPAWHTSARNSYGNVFLWKNFLTPHGDATNINNQDDLTFVGVDAETWNETNDGTNALIKTGPMGTLRIFSISGGNHGLYPTPAFDVAADEFQLYNNLMEASRGGTADYVLRPANLRSLLVNSSSPRVYDDKADDAFRVKAFEADDAFYVNGTVQSILTPGQQAILSSMVIDKRPGEPWEAPRHGAIPDPAGPAWKQNITGQPDNTDYIQGLIDANGVARLPAGIYYISRPLKVKTNGGIIGAGADKTAIIAMNNTFDMIVTNDKDATLPSGRKIILSGLTLQGGANGIHFEPVGTGTRTADGKPIRALNTDGTPKVDSNGNPVYVRAQYTACYFNDVTFSDMSVAGIFMDQIYALDNIFMSYLNFVNCDVGWKQKVDPAYVSGDTPTMMYMDKVLLYRCQFVGNRIAMYLSGKRGCYLNAWVNCRFENNREGAAVMNNYVTPMFDNCDFINNGGTAVVSNNLPLSFVSCRFRAGSDGMAMFKGPVSAEGCSFDRDGSAGATILKLDPYNVKVFFMNCIANDMPLGLTPKISGMLVNSVMIPSDQVNQRMVLIKGGSIQSILNETTTGMTPIPQLLFGSDWSADSLLSNYSGIVIAIKPDMQKNSFKARAYPNPATGWVHIDFSLPEKSKLTIALYQENGMHLKTISNKEFEAGNQNIDVNLSGFSNGFYFIKLTSDNDTQTIKLIKN